MKSKIVSTTDPKPYESKNGVLYYRNFTLENGETINLGSKEENPSWGQVGQELEYEEAGVNSKGNPKYKRITPQKQFGGKKIVSSYQDILGMVRSNAIHAVVSVNAALEQEVISSADLRIIELFTLGNIEGDIDKFGQEERLLTSRLAAVNNAAIAAKYKKIQTAEALVQLATQFYKYTTK